jgi:hypothetical protein
MAILLLNVGAIDLQVRGINRETGKPINVSASGRSDAQAILDHYAEQEFVDAYDGTVLEPGVVGWPLVSKYLQWFRDRGRRLEQVVIFGTDQPVTVSRRSSDTLIGAQVLARCVADHGADVVDAGGVHPAVLDVDGADRHDRCLERFQALLPEVARAGSGRVHVAVTGGTPGANFGLLLAAQSIWGDRVQALAARVNAPAFPLDVARQLRVAFQRQPVADLLRRGQFATAASIVESWGEPRLQPVARAATAMRHWLDLAHGDAFDLVNDASDNASLVGITDLDAVLRDLTNDLRHRKQIGTDPNHQGTVQLLVDVYWNGDLCLQQERYVDFVARMALILERAIQSFVEYVVGARVPNNQEKDPYGVQAFWEAVKASNVQVSADLEPPRRIDLATYMSMAGSIASLGDRDRAVTTAATIIKVRTSALQGLREVRNRSVVGHDVGPVTKQIIAGQVDGGLARAYKAQAGTDLNTKRGVAGVATAIRDILKELGHEPTGPNPFLTYGDRLARALLEVPL